MARNRGGETATIKVPELVRAASAAFAFLIERGYALSIEISSPACFKGGFILTYSLPGVKVRVQYLDMEIVVTRDEEEVFGFRRPGSFAGNMFSRENLLKCVDRIAAEVRSELD